MIGVVEASIEIDGNVSGLPALALVASLGNGAAFLGINIILQSQRFPFFAEFFCTQISYKDRSTRWFIMTSGVSAGNLSIGGKVCTVLYPLLPSIMILDPETDSPGRRI